MRHVSFCTFISYPHCTDTPLARARSAHSLSHGWTHVGDSDRVHCAGGVSSLTVCGFSVTTMEARSFNSPLTVSTSLSGLVYSLILLCQFGLSFSTIPWSRSTLLLFLSSY